MPEAKAGLDSDGGTQVNMAIGRTLDDVPSATSSDAILWTTYMTQCCAIATFDFEADDGDVQRTLYHAQGSNPSDPYFKTLVSMINPDHTTYVIIGNGSDDDKKESFEIFAVANVKEKLTAAMKKAKKSMDNVTFKIFFTLKEDDKKNDLEPGSFALDESGFWGRIVSKVEKKGEGSKKEAVAGGTKSGIASKALSLMAVKPQAKAAAGDEDEDDEAKEEAEQEEDEDAGDEDADEEEQGNADEPADEDDEGEKEGGDDDKADEEGNDEKEADEDEEQEDGDEAEEGDENAEAEEGEEGEDEEEEEEEEGDKK
jgi:hypothetical protein